MRFAFLLCLLLASPTSVHSAEEASQADRWIMGVGRTKITPKQPMWMSGYGSRDRPADGTLTDLWCKALVLEDGQGQQGVLISLDLVGIDRGLATHICQQLFDQHGLHRHQISFCCSHTHTGPALQRNLAPLPLSRCLARSSATDRGLHRMACGPGGCGGTNGACREDAMRAEFW